MNKFNKKGMNVDFYTVIFLLLNLVFFAMMFIFISNSSNSSLAYEQHYAKEIAMLVDSATPGMIFNIDFTKGFDIAKENSKLKDLVIIDEENNLIKVSLRNSGGYQMVYFTDYSFKVRESPETKKILIEVLDDKQ